MLILSGFKGQKRNRYENIYLKRYRGPLIIPKNLETHLDRIVLAYETYEENMFTKSISLRLSHVEIYIICAAILFHDLGRIRSSNDHGKETKRILINEEQYAKLGIPGRELAQAIANICEFHTCVQNENDPYKQSEVSNIAINPYGRINCHKLAALLVLIDEMDDTFNRVLLESLQDSESTNDIKLQFRKTTQDVYIDPARQTVFTVIDSIETSIFEIHKKVLSTKVEILKRIQENLARLGIEVHGWRLECDEHLYNQDGKETYESCFYQGYLKEVLGQMWDLSTQIFGSLSFTYENLAAAMCEKDVNIVRIAVYRLAIMAQKYCIDKRKNLGIWAGNEQWRWLTKKDLGQPCIYISKKEMEEVLKKAEKEMKGQQTNAGL